MEKAFKKYQQHEYNEAINTLLTIEQTSEIIYRFLGQCYYEIGNLNDAEKFIVKAIENGNTNGFNLYASILSDLNRKDEAEKYYKVAIDNGDYEALNNYAILLAELGKIEEAEKLYLKAIQHDIPNSIYNYANLLSENDDRNKAEMYFIMAIDKGNNDAFQMLLFNYYFDGNRQKVINLLLKYKGMDYPKLLNDILQLWLGNLTEYHKVRNSLTLHDINDKPKFYLRESLVHYQYDWVVDLLIGNTELKEEHEPLYFAAIMLQDPKLDINLMIPESMLETVQNIIDYVKERQVFYYGTSKNN
ncbi:MAG: tetratricopeptide repeat protein [Saprospiraceae bacterium]|nr:tetratricopeptide repeat protein [Saprospiraceae bacterium]